MILQLAHFKLRISSLINSSTGCHIWSNLLPISFYKTFLLPGGLAHNSRRNQRWNMSHKSVISSWETLRHWHLIANQTCEECDNQFTFFTEASGIHVKSSCKSVSLSCEQLIQVATTFLSDLVSESDIKMGVVVFGKFFANMFYLLSAWLR